MTPRSAEPTPTRRQQSAAASRERTRVMLLDAADSLFADQGYVASSVSAIASGAGVTVQTLYLAWGSKSALFRACAVRAMAGSSLPLADDEWREHIRSDVRRRMAGSDAAEAFIIALADVIVSIANRAGAYWALYQEAAVVDSEIDWDWQALTALRRRTFRLVMQEFPEHRLRAGLDLDRAADTLWAVASPEMHRFYVRAAGESGLDYPTWLRTTMVAAVVAPDIRP